MTILAQTPDSTSDETAPPLYEHAEVLTAPQRTAEQVRVDAIANSLRQLADFVHGNPQLAGYFEYTALDTKYNGLNIPVGREVDQRAAVAEFARAAARAGCAVTKHPMGVGDNMYGVRFRFGTIGLSVYGDREQVCERVVVDVREVTEEVPDPQALAAVPTTTVTRTEEIVEWKCGPLLAAAGEPVVTGVENTSARDPMLHLIGAVSDGTAGYIEGLEAAGQRQLVNSDRLPVDMGDRAEYEALGFAFGEPVQGDPLFIAATLPADWKRQPSDHSMYSHIVDAAGHRRVAIFYKAAPYDRRAHMHIERVS